VGTACPHPELFFPFSKVNQGNAPGRWLRQPQTGQSAPGGGEPPPVGVGTACPHQEMFYRFHAFDCGVRFAVGCVNSGTTGPGSPRKYALLQAHSDGALTRRARAGLVSM